MGNAKPSESHGSEIVVVNRLSGKRHQPGSIAPKRRDFLVTSIIHSLRFRIADIGKAQGDTVLWPM